MSAIFKPTPLSWEDVEGGLGEATLETIREFIGKYAYGDENVQKSDSDEELANDLAFFSEKWERIDGYSWNTKVSDTFQTAAVLSLVDGAFYDSGARDRIAEKLEKSATKPELVKIISHVASAYCEYISLKARIEIAEIEREKEAEE